MIEKGGKGNRRDQTVGSGGSKYWERGLELVQIRDEGNFQESTRVVPAKTRSNEGYRK